MTQKAGSMVEIKCSCNFDWIQVYNIATVILYSCVCVRFFNIILNETDSCKKHKLKNQLSTRPSTLNTRHTVCIYTHSHNSSTSKCNMVRSCPLLKDPPTVATIVRLQNSGNVVQKAGSKEIKWRMTTRSWRSSYFLQSQKQSTRILHLQNIRNT